MAVATYRKHISTVTTTDRFEYINERVGEIPGYSVSMYVSDIIEEWLKRGAPPVNKNDVVIPLPKFMEIEKYQALRRPKKLWSTPL